MARRGRSLEGPKTAAIAVATVCALVWIGVLGKIVVHRLANAESGKIALATPAPNAERSSAR
jgi:hypothetical protein